MYIQIELRPIINHIEHSDGKHVISTPFSSLSASFEIADDYTKVNILKLNLSEYGDFYNIIKNPKCTGIVVCQIEDRGWLYCNGRTLHELSSRNEIGDDGNYYELITAVQDWKPEFTDFAARLLREVLVNDL